MGAFAYGCSYVPGAADDTQLVAFSRRLNGGTDLDDAELSKFRRIFFESFTMVQADLRLRLERSEDAPVRRLAVPERAARYRAQVNRLPGLNLLGELECSDALVDNAVSQFDENRIRYIRWEQCTRKRDEVQGVKKLEDIFRKAPDGTLKAAQSLEPAIADTSDTYALRNALSRRALAYDQANLISFSVHEEWTTKLFECLVRPVVPGYSPILMDQIQRADTTLFERLAELTRDGITPDALGNRPLDAAIRTAFLEHQVTHHLNPLPASAKRAREDETDDRNGKPKNKGRGKAGKAAGRGRGNANGKGGNKAGKIPALPQGLSGSSRTSDGSHICFSYNFGKCSEQDKKGCIRGKHVCCKCGAHHAFVGSQCAEAGA